MKTRLKIALLIEQNSSHTRGIAKGISLYAQTHGPWIFFAGEQNQARLIAPPLENLMQFDGDGIIAYTRDEKLLEQILKLDLPVVNTTHTSIPITKLPCVYTDDRALGRRVAEYFIDRGFKEFAFCQSVGTSIWSQERGKGFAEVLQEQNLSLSQFPSTGKISRRINWENDREKVAEWLQTLNVPVAVFADNDSCGRILLELCSRLDIHVPEELAVVGADNDELICEFSNPYLSSAALAKEQVGFEAAKLLEQMIRKNKPPTEPILVPPLGITTRRSSDIFAVEDKHVAEALNFIHNHAGEQISVTDVLKRVPLCRRYLELRFRKATGRSPYEEIRKAHVERAKKLLSETVLPMDRIAEAAGFSEPKNFYINFRKEVKMSPTQYRKQFKITETQEP